MSASRTARARRIAVNAALVFAFACAPLGAGADSLSHLESQCAQQLAGGALKLLKTHVRVSMACRDRRASGSSVTCPEPAAVEKLDAALVDLAERAVERCGSRCSISANIPCVDNLHCPPLSPLGEGCTAGAKALPFDMANLGYPGPFCETALGRPIAEPRDLGVCAGALLAQTTDRLLDALYGGPTGPPVLSEQAQACLSAMSAGARQIILATFKNAAKCRANVVRGKIVANPSSCLDTVPKLRGKVEKVKSKARSLIIGACPPPVLDEIPACGTVAGFATSSQAANCLVDLATEATDPRAVPADREVVPAFLEAVFPPIPVCGDGVVNQKPNAFLPVGEECDGADDDACPGLCIEPGDVFECTCGNVARMRLFTDTDLSENDSGWTGLGHDQALGHLSGFVSSLSNCDCGHMENGECVGGSTDPICDVHGDLAPRCSWSTNGGGTCANDSDCFICDSSSVNAGAACSKDDDCDSQCCDSAGVPSGPCDAQADCPAGEVCRGRCDTTQSCILIPNGAPHPASAGGIAVCAVQTFRTDLTGTRNLLNGAHELYYRQFSRIYLPESQNRPCPVCGGFCTGGSNNLDVCKGRCSGTDTPCRFDHECPMGSTCSESSPDCPGGKCTLALVCGADESLNPGVAGRPCSIAYEDPVFGTPSSDCQPYAERNITGQGLELDYLPATSGTRTLPSTLPCTSPGWELYDCPCPDDGGQPTAPNSCIPACNAVGPSFGAGCADGGSGSGAGTVCDGGANDGRLCDEDTDCPSGSCSRNPLHCVGDPETFHKPCTLNSECGLGLCVDACLGGRCVPLCLDTPGDPGEGTCAAGPLDYHCSGAQWDFVPCDQASASAGCAAMCVSNSASCTSDDDCPVGDQCTGSCENARACEAGPDGVLGNGDDLEGAGLCEATVHKCFTDPIVATGAATTLSEHDSVATWCFGATLNPGVNTGSGFGGPGRVEIRGQNVINFTSIPP